MKAYQFFTYFFISLLGIVSCTEEPNDPESPNKEPSGSEYTVSSETVELSEEQFGYVIESTQSTIRFKASTPDSLLPSVGEKILVFEKSDVFPNGFLGRVTTVSNEGGSILVSTEAVALDEAFDYLRINEDTDFLPAGVTKASVEKDDDGFNMLSQDVSLTINQLTVSGEISAGIRCKTDILIDNKTGERKATIILDRKLSGELGVALQGEVDPVKIPIGKAIPFGAASVLFGPSLQFYLNVNFSGEVNANPIITLSQRETTTLQLVDDKWKVDSTSEKADDDCVSIDPGFDVHLSGSLFIGVISAVELKLFSRDDKKIAIEPNAGVEFSTDVDFSAFGEGSYDSFCDSKCDVALKVSIDAAVEFNFFKLSADFSTTLLGTTLWSKSFWFLPEFTDYSLDRGESIWTGKSGVKRDLLIKTPVGLAVYEGKTLKSTGGEQEYKWEKDFTDKLEASFDVTKADAPAVWTYVKWGDKIIRAKRLDSSIVGAWIRVSINWIGGSQSGDIDHKINVFYEDGTGYLDLDTEDYFAGYYSKDDAIVYSYDSVKQILTWHYADDTSIEKTSLVVDGDQLTITIGEGEEREWFIYERL